MKPVRKEQESKQTKQSILESFSKYSKNLGRIPTYSELEVNCQYTLFQNGKTQKKGLTKTVIEYHFTSLSQLSRKAMDACPEYFTNVVEEKIYMPQKMKELKQVLGKNIKNVIVTSANGDNMPLFTKGLEVMRTFAKIHNAVIVVGATNGNLDSLPQELYEADDIHVLFDDVHLNNAICLSTTPINPKTENPVASPRLKKLARKNNSSMVFFSPVKGEDSVACNINRHPDTIYSTGSISLPKYKTNGKVTLSDTLAKENHNFSFLLIELEGNNKFFARHMTMEASTGECIDFGIRYKANGKMSFVGADATSYGDIHSYVKDEQAFNTALECSQIVESKEGIVHDIADNSTVSHHKANKRAEKASQIMAGEANYGHEIKVLTGDFDALTSVHPKGVRVVPSNHDDMDSRALEDGGFIADNNNSVYGTMLFPYQVAWNLVSQGKKNVAKIMADYLHVSEKELIRRYPGIEKGIAPLQAAVELCGPKSPEKITWHRRNDSYQIARCELLLHGDKGANGGGYSVSSAKLAIASGSAISGHSHSSKVQGEMMVLGCLAQKKQTYNMGGFSSWTHSFALVYKNGSKQLVKILDGKYTNFNLKALIKKAKQSK